MKLTVICLFSLIFGLSYGHSVNFETSRFIEMKGKVGVKHFMQNQQVRMIYFYKKDTKMTTFFLQELEKSSEFLEMYGVKIGFCDCTMEVNKDVVNCGKENIDESVHTYRMGNLLLSLELQTMFDVNSIMSNVLQLVMLREVPILQTLQEVEKYLSQMRGKKDIVFGHMKAIGTSDHRVFMEVAYAYISKLQFVVCTDSAATKLFESAPVTGDDASTVWWVWTAQMERDESYYHNIRYKGELNLKSLAKFANVITKPLLFDITAEGVMHPYADLDLPIVKFYYDMESKETVYQKAHVMTRFYGGSIGILLVDCDSEMAKMNDIYNGKKPAMSIQHNGDGDEKFLQGDVNDSDNIAKFMDEELGVEIEYHSTHDDDVLQEDYTDEEDQYMGRDEETFDSNIEAVEKQDDIVAEFVERTKKIKMTLDLVPALTDKTFPEAVTKSPVAVVLFYIPFDAVSMGNLRMYGEAAEMLGKQTSLKVARVNCYDWTDVCQKENIIIYPTLRVYKDGKQAWDYKGPQDTNAMYSTLKLLDLSSPVYETDSGELLNYITNNQKNELASVTNTTVVGLFRKEDKKEMAVFKSFAEDCRDRILFAYSDIDDSSVIAKTFGANLPAVILSKHDDNIQPHVVFNQKYTIQNLEQFVNDNKLPKVTVLTPLMLPEVRRKFSDLVILFTDGSETCQQSEESLREIVKSQKFNNVSFNMMPVPDESSVGFRVLSLYVPVPTVPFLSLVNFQKGEVFNFGAVSDVPALSTWLTNVVGGSTQPSTTLKQGEWKPLNKGYEFLKILEWEQQQARKKAAPKSSDNHQKDDAVNPVEEEYSAEDIDGQIPKFVEDADESDTRKDLFDLNKSRLYHQAPGRVSHHGKQDPTKENTASGDSHQDKNVGQDQGESNKKNPSQKGKKHDPTEF